MSLYLRYPAAGSGGGGVPIYANAGALPASATDGSLAVTADTDTLYAYNAGTLSWVAIASPGSVLSIGTIDTGSPSANGAHITANALILQSASTSNPGLMNTGTQSIAGAKTFTGAITASNLSGTNTGDVTIGSANGLSLASQALSLAAASTSTTGALTSADWNTFNNKQASGSYITALTGDGTASGPGSAAFTLAAVSAGGTFPKVTFNTKGLVTSGTTLVSGDIPNNAANTTGTASNVTGVVALVNGGTGTAAASANAAFNALSPMTTLGDVIYGGASGAGTRLGVGSNGQVLTLAAGVPSWATPTTGTVTSVALTVPSFLSVAGSPISTSGTLAISLSGTALPITNGGTSGTTAAGAFSALSPITTTGDIIYSSAGTTNSRLAIGSTGNVLTVAGGVPTWAAPATNGTVTSVTLTVPNILSVSGSPVTTSGTLAVTLASQSANTVLAGPTSGGATTPTFRALTVADQTIAAQAIAATTIDWSTGNVFTKTLGASTTFTFSNQLSGQTIVVRLTNTASNFTVTWPSVKWSGGSQPVQTIGAKSDVWTFIYDGSNTYGSVVQNMS